MTSVGTLELPIDTPSILSSNKSSTIGSKISIRSSNDTRSQTCSRRGRLKLKLCGPFHLSDRMPSAGPDDTLDDTNSFRKKLTAINDTRFKDSNKHHKRRFWRTKKDGTATDTSHSFEDKKTDLCSIASSKSTKVNSEANSDSGGNVTQKYNPKDYEEVIVFRRSPKHHFRRWLNEQCANNEPTSSILEIRQSNVTTRIIKARHAISMAAEKTARIAVLRLNAQSAAFAGAVTAAAFARVRAAEKDPSASHGSIANAAMYATQEVAKAIANSDTSDGDLTKLNDIFRKHFEYKGPGYFKRLRPLSIQDSNKKSAAYKMYHKMKDIPNPPIGVDPLEYYLRRSTEREMKRQKIEDVSFVKTDMTELRGKTTTGEENSEKGIPSRTSTAKSTFWSFIGFEPENTKKIENDDSTATCSQTRGTTPKIFLREIFGKPSLENKKSEEDNMSMMSSKSTFWTFISGSSC
ncbi:(ZYRO0G10230g) [Zygosaccharomyces parabailii]|nr:(ZYRO0G10230g) [Zygosaccharomyces parabailii]